MVIILSQGLTFSISISRRQNAFTCFLWLSEQPATVFLMIKPTKLVAGNVIIIYVLCEQVVAFVF